MYLCGVVVWRWLMTNLAPFCVSIELTFDLSSRFCFHVRNPDQTVRRKVLNPEHNCIGRKCTSLIPIADDLRGWCPSRFLSLPENGWMAQDMMNVLSRRFVTVNIPTTECLS